MDFIIIIIVIISVLFIIYQIPQVKGFVGEKLVTLTLKSFIKDNGYVIDNYLGLDSNNESFQIDHILICKKGIFVIETKNYAGIIYGEVNANKFYQYLNNGKTKQEFYSPVKQNETHVKKLNKITSYDNKTYGIVCFIRNNFKNKDVLNITCLKDLKKYLLKFDKDVLSSDDVENIHQLLLSSNNYSVANFTKHVNSINNKQKSGLEKCPMCGAKLVLKKGTYGNFYGCSRYPDCKFVKKIGDKNGNIK